MKKFSLVLAAALVLSGCGASGLPATPEEHDQVVEYAAGLLLKYDKNYSRQLVSIAMPTPTPEGTDEDDTAETADPAQSGNGEETPAPTPTPTPTPTPIPTARIADMVNVPGLSFAYAGFEVADVYPPDTTYGVVTPMAGHKLLVAKYDVTNNTDADITLDIYSQNWEVRVGYNGNSSTMTRVILTLLPNDMENFVGDIAAGETVTLVSFSDVAVGSADEVQSVQINIRTATGVVALDLNN